MTTDASHAGMDRRTVVTRALGLSAALFVPAAGAQAGRWGADRGYPTGWRGGLNRDPAYRVGNYSGGFEAMLPHHVLAAPTQASPLRETPLPDFRYRWGFSSRTPAEYMAQWPVTGLMICRDADILFERYGLGRDASMRLTSWSMAKSVTSLLLGICLDRGLIHAYDDPAQKYVPELEGTLHGGVTLRNLSNMSSGAEVSHERDNPRIYPAAYLSPDASIARTVASWNQRREEQGRTYNYNELCPLTLGMVIRRVTGGSLSAFAQQALWQPMGAEADATWSTDSQRQEFNCIGLAARLRDWARLGLLVARRGRQGTTQVLSSAWIDECTRWGELDRQGRFGVAMPHAGYKAHMWHNKPDGSRLYFNGHHGQRVMIDMPTKTVMVHTAVEHEGAWQSELLAMFETATRL